MISRSRQQKRRAGAQLTCDQGQRRCGRRYAARSIPEHLNRWLANSDSAATDRRGAFRARGRTPCGGFALRKDCVRSMTTSERLVHRSSDERHHWNGGAPFTAMFSAAG
ncbi:unnamed protein product, partial [Iphiclides podalirius]